MNLYNHADSRRRSRGMSGQDVLSDEALAEAMLPGDPEGLAVVRRLSPQQRALYEHMLWVADELNAGRIPPGVML